MSDEHRLADDWDAIVVGSGMGGLTCAAYLAVTGHRVLVLEQAGVLGGNSHVFRRRSAYEFDAGVHYIGDCGPDGVLPSILRGLGLGDRVTFREMDPDGFDEVVLPGLRMSVPVGWDRYLDRLAEVLPEDKDGLREFVAVCSAVGAEMRWTLLSAVGAEPAEVLRRTPTAVAWGRRTLHELFEHCGLSAAARTVLAAQALNYGIGPEEATVGMHASVTDHYLRGAAYPVGGGQMLAASLTEAITGHGGAVRTGHRVERVLVEQGRACGVVLADGGRELRAPVVVSNADYVRTVRELAGEEHFPASIGKRARTAVTGFPLVVLYVGLDRELPGRTGANLWWHGNADIEEAFRGLAEGRFDTPPSVFISFASLKDPDTAALRPPGHANFQVMALCPRSLEAWGAAAASESGGPYRRDPAYLAEKERVTEAMLATAERALGPFRRYVTHLELATPATQRRYTRSTGGSPFGLARWGGTGARPDTRTSVTGLYVVGQSTRYGSGITGAAVSGTACAGQILGRPLLPEVHAGAVLGDPSRLPGRGPDWDPLRLCGGRARRGTRPG
ncbi:phytoene desaturase family protein [Streptomyces sp. NPDC014889]|uniref:phytoene desaturase family protein n=1 Tax=Streptomyces sp. NPDC014889 TaxID=3364928 RepID=UPI0036FA52C7